MGQPIGPTRRELLGTAAVAGCALLSRGVPAGATIANQELNTKPGNPDSDTVGTSGNCGRRRSVVTPISRSWPPRTNAATVPKPWKPTGTCPAATSVAACVAPL